MDDGEENSLSQLYSKAQQLQQQLETLQTSSRTYNEMIREAISAIEKCKSAVDHVALFSPNETLEDLTTSSLQYLCLDQELGDLLQRDWARDRKTALRGAQRAYAEFLQLLDQYELLAAGDRQLLARVADDRDHFSVVGATADPAARRGAKIARLKDEKALKARLDLLRRQPGALAGDDDALRALRLAELQLKTMAVFQSLDLIAQEIAVLALAPPEEVPRADPRALAEDHRVRTTGQQAGDGYSERLDPNVRSMLRNGKAGPILDARGKPLQPFVLLDKRTDLRKGVFRPGHSLPTMSIDEYLEEERRRGGIIEGGGEPPVVEPNEDDVEAADRETIKQREWDEFKEENPRGSGNTLNKG